MSSEASLVHDSAEPLSTAQLHQPGRLVLRDTWFPIAHSSALRDKPIRRWLHGTAIVLWRDGSGTARAMEDRCCHRRAPLSEGRIIDGCLQCPYHGWIYDGSGQVVKIPSMGDDYRVPKNCAVPTYPLVQRSGHLWVWWGNPNAADVALIPDVPFVRHDGTAPVEGTLLYDVPQELLVENILDLTHIDYVHGGLLGNPGGGTEEISTEYTDETITTVRTTRGRKPPAALAPLFGFPRTQDIYNVTRVYVRSGCAIATITYSPPGWGLWLFITNTPERPDHIRQDFSQQIIGPWWWRKLLPMANRTIQKQDLWILRMQHPQYEQDDGRLDRSAPIDAPSLRYRMARKKIAQRQVNGDFSYATGWQGSDAAKLLRVPI